MSDNHLLLPPTQSSSGSIQRPTGSITEIHHVSYLSDHIGALYLNDEYSDITLTIQSIQFKAHKVILAARSEYFRAMLFGGMKESGQQEIELQDTNVAAFKLLLKYIYTGRITLANVKEDLIMEILGLAHKYGFSELEVGISDYLKATLSVQNLCTILGASHLFSLTSLKQFCFEFADRNATEVLNSEGFVHLSPDAAEQLISRDSFCAPEIEIFKAVREWIDSNPYEESDTLYSHIRLPLITLDDLLDIVRPSGLIPADVILDAIREQTSKRDMELKYRGFLFPEVNMATPAQGAQVVEGELKQSLLNGDTTNYDMERGFTRHPIEERTEGIVVQMGSQCIINHIRLLLWDKDMRMYSYYVEVSMNKTDWVRVADHSNYLCRSWQKLYFSPKVVKYVRVVGTHNSVNRVFHLVALEAYYTTRQFTLNGGLVVPSENVATVENSAAVIEGVSRSRNALLNGDVEHYDWDSGYTCHQLGSGSIVIQLPQPYLIDSMRMLLWDCDDRTYSYYVEVSTDQQQWKLVADKTKEACRSWQYLSFERSPVVFVRIVGTNNTANEVFHCVHFECPAQVSPVSVSTDSVHGGPSVSAVRPEGASSLQMPSADGNYS